MYTTCGGKHVWKWSMAWVLINRLTHGQIVRIWDIYTRCAYYVIDNTFQNVNDTSIITLHPTFIIQSPLFLLQMGIYLTFHLLIKWIIPCCCFSFLAQAWSWRILCPERVKLKPALVPDIAPYPYLRGYFRVILGELLRTVALCLLCLEASCPPVICCHRVIWNFLVLKVSEYLSLLTHPSVNLF